jgi:hypothetical protein
MASLGRALAWRTVWTYCDSIMVRLYVVPARWESEDAGLQQSYGAHTCTAMEHASILSIKLNTSPFEQP